MTQYGFSKNIFLGSALKKHLEYDRVSPDLSSLVHVSILFSLGLCSSVPFLTLCPAIRVSTLQQT